MANDTSSGTWDKVKGKTNETVGKLTGNKEQEMKGKMQEGVGEGKHAVRDLKDKLEE